MTATAVTAGEIEMTVPVTRRNLRKMRLADLYPPEWTEEEVHQRLDASPAKLASKRSAAQQAQRRRDRKLRLEQIDREQRTGAGKMRPTAELESRHEIVVEDRTVEHGVTGLMVRSRGARVMTQTPLDRYYRRGLIDERQFKAGDDLRGQWFVSGLEPHTVGNLLGTGGGSECSYGMARHEGQAMFREMWRAAIQAVGMRLSPVLIAVCCEDRSALDWLLSTGRRGDMKRLTGEAMVILRLALDVLADHYKGVVARVNAARAS